MVGVLSKFQDLCHGLHAGSSRLQGQDRNGGPRLPTHGSPTSYSVSSGHFCVRAGHSCGASFGVFLTANFSETKKSQTGTKRE